MLHYAVDASTSIGTCGNVAGVMQSLKLEDTLNFCTQKTPTLLMPLREQ